MRFICVIDVLWVYVGLAVWVRTSLLRDLVPNPHPSEIHIIKVFPGISLR